MTMIQFGNLVLASSVIFGIVGGLIYIKFFAKEPPRFR